MGQQICTREFPNVLSEFCSARGRRPRAPIRCQRRGASILTQQQYSCRERPHRVLTNGCLVGRKSLKQNNNVKRRYGPEEPPECHSELRLIVRFRFDRIAPKSET